MQSTGPVHYIRADLQPQPYSQYCRNEAIGIYKFDTSGDGIPNPLQPCLSPALPDGAVHTYINLSFGRRGSGIYIPVQSERGKLAIAIGQPPRHREQIHGTPDCTNAAKAYNGGA